MSILISLLVQHHDSNAGLCLLSALPHVKLSPSIHWHWYSQKFIHYGRGVFNATTRLPAGWHQIESVLTILTSSAGSHTQVHATRRGGGARGEPARAGHPLRPELRQRPGVHQLASGEPELHGEGGVRVALVQLHQHPGLGHGQRQRRVRAPHGQRVQPRALPARQGLARRPQRVRRRQPRRQRQRQPLLGMRRRRRRGHGPGLGALDASGELLPPGGRAGPRRGVRRAGPGMDRAAQRDGPAAGPGPAAPFQGARPGGGAAVHGALPPGHGDVRGAQQLVAGAGPLQRDGGVDVQHAAADAGAAGHQLAHVPPCGCRRQARAPRRGLLRRARAVAPRIGLQDARRRQRDGERRLALPGRRRGRPERGHQPVPVPERRPQLRPGEPVVQARDQHEERG
jgi:hypothetical protein